MSRKVFCKNCRQWIVPEKRDRQDPWGECFTCPGHNGVIFSDDFLASELIRAVRTMKSQDLHPDSWKEAERLLGELGYPEEI